MESFALPGVVIGLVPVAIHLAGVPRQLWCDPFPGQSNGQC